MVALKSIRPSSAGGVDGLLPGHLKELFTPQTVEAGRRLLKALANLCSKLIRGQIPKHTCDLLFAANLTALRKKDGGIRPIAVGKVYRRLASMISAKRIMPELRRQLPRFNSVLASVVGATLQHTVSVLSSNPRLCQETTYSSNWT